MKNAVLAVAAVIAAAAVVYSLGRPIYAAVSAIPAAMSNAVEHAGEDRAGRVR